MNRIFILDRSGSMNSCIEDTIGGYNSFIDTQKEIGGTISLYLFDYEISLVYENKNIEDVEPLDKTTYIPRGSTALYDAIGYVVTKNKTCDKTVVIVMTDGKENSSRDYTLKSINDIISMKKSEGVEFLFLGADPSTFDDAEKIGIGRDRIMKYETHDSPAAFEAVTKYLRARSSGVDNPDPLSTNHRATH